MNRRLISALLSLNLMFGGVASAGNHPLTAITFDKSSGTTYVDQVVHIDWDIDKPPIVSIEGVATPLDRTYILETMRVASDTLYKMTEGKMRLGKISVYSNAFAGRADMLILNKDGRANAHLSGLNISGHRNEMFTTFGGRGETTLEMGRTIAHEFGHYFFGLLDEYREAGKLSTEDPGSPQDRDTPRNTIMNNHLSFDVFSLPADYVDLNGRQTAQFRWFGKSAWETLTSNPATDSDLQKNSGVPPRIWFESFKAMPVPTTLTAPTDTFKSRSNLQITYMAKSPRVALVIDLNVAQQELDGFVKSAVLSLNAMPAGTLLSVLTVAGSDFVNAGTFPPLGEGDADITRTTIRNLLTAGLKAVAGSGTGGLDKALRQASVLVSPLAAAQDTALKGGLPAPLTTSVEITQTPEVYVYTTTASSVADTTISALNSGGVMVLSELLNKGNNGNMEALAKSARGKAIVANSTAELEKKAMHEMHSALGDSAPTIASQKFDKFAAGSRLEMKFLVASSAIDGKVTLEAMVGKNTGMALELKAPSGAVATESNATSLGLTFKRNDAEGTMAFYIPTTVAGRAGTWTATLVAANASVEAVELEAEVDSKLVVDVAVIGGTKEDPRVPIITAMVTQPFAVKNAVVTADIYDASGNLVKAGLVLKDDGVGADAKPGDGKYSASLAGMLTQSGDYDIEVHVSNAGLQATYGTGGTLVSGANNPDIGLGENFNREEGVDFAFQSNSVGGAIVEAVHSGGGCTLGRNAPFDPLFLLTLAAAGLYLWRRKADASHGAQASQRT